MESMFQGITSADPRSPYLGLPSHISCLILTRELLAILWGETHHFILLWAGLAGSDFLS